MARIQRWSRGGVWSIRDDDIVEISSSRSQKRCSLYLVILESATEKPSLTIEVPIQRSLQTPLQSAYMLNPKS